MVLTIDMFSFLDLEAELADDDVGFGFFALSIEVTNGYVTTLCVEQNSITINR